MPFNEPASLHDWHGGPPIIPVTWTGKASDGIFLISPSINLVSGKLALNVGHIFCRIHWQQQYEILHYGILCQDHQRQKKTNQIHIYHLQLKVIFTAGGIPTI